MNSKTLLLTLLAAAAVAAVKRNYDGYKVYNVIPKTKDEIETLAVLQRSGVAEFWDEHFDVNHIVKVMVSPQKQVEFLDRLKQDSVKATEVIENVQKLIDDQLKPTTRNVAQNTTFLSLNWERYFSVEEINTWLDELATTYPDIVTTIVIGQSFEGRDIKGIKIDYKPGENDLIGMIEGCIHAREWISPATVTWIIKEFLTSTNSEVRVLAENFQWHLFPVVNPDGYSYTFTDNRLWRKNRSTRNFTSCQDSGVEDDMSNGVDLNRNFDYAWMTVGASSDPCSNTFAGPSPGSEPETQAITQYVLQLKDQGEFIYYISFHSYTQLIIMPYSHLSVDDVGQPDNIDDLVEIAMTGALAVHNRYGTQYRVGVSEQVMYLMSGASFDWVKNAANVPVTYLFELRDLGEYGFLLPQEQIVQNNLEIMDGLLEMEKATRRLDYYYISESASIVYSLGVVIFGVIFSILFN